MGKEINIKGEIIDPIRCDWVPGGVFVTPPGWWHSHHNESDTVAWVLPMQDAGWGLPHTPRACHVLACYTLPALSSTLILYPRFFSQLAPNDVYGVQYCQADRQRSHPFWTPAC